MPLAVTHVLTSIISADIYRDYYLKHKRYFTLHTVLLAGIGGLLPDIDFPLRMIANFFSWEVPWLLQHGGMTHTPFFGLLFLIPGIILWKKRKHKKAMCFYALAFGIFLHIFLDFLIGGGRYEGIMLFFPFSLAGFKIHLLQYVSIKDIPIAMDAIILLGWLWHEERKHKIKDFI